MQRGNGESFPAEGSASFIEVRGKPLFTLFFRDVSQRVAAGREIERLSRTARYLREEIEDNLDLEQVERQHMSRVLQKYGWVIDGEQGAALALGLHPSTLRNRMRKLCIERPS